MNIPNFPLSAWISKTGENQYFIHPEVMGVFRQLFIEMQQNLSNEGFSIPQQNTANIAIIGANPAPPIGRIIYNSEAHSFVGNVNGVFKTFTMS